MQVAIDAREREGLGINRYVENLVREFSQLDHQHTLAVFRSISDNDRMTELDDANTRFISTRVRPYSLREHVNLSLKLRRQKFDLVHFTDFNVPLTYRGPFIVTIHDLHLRTHPWQPKRARLWHWPLLLKHWFQLFELRSAVRRARRVLVPSQATADEIPDAWGIAPERIDVIPYGAKASFHTAGLTHNPVSGGNAYLLYVGGCYPYKNVELLVDLMDRLRGQGSDLSLILVGPDDGFQQEIRRRVEGLGLSGSINFRGQVGDEELDSLYAHALAVVIPSLSEGFGLVGLEAMIRGVPVLSSDRRPMQEVYGTAPLYFDPTEVTGLERLVTQLRQDEALQSCLSKGGIEHAKQFSWSSTAALTLRSYEASLIA
jgi:glycosyltransferase involved in cell wall biosynthesis